GDERLLSRTGENYGPHRRIVLHLQYGTPEVVHRRSIPRVENLGGVDCEDGDRAFKFDEQVFKGHDGRVLGDARTVAKLYPTPSRHPWRAHRRSHQRTGPEYPRFARVQTPE